MKITIEELNEKRKILIYLLQKEEEKSDMSKLKYAILKWDKQVSKIISDIQKEYTNKFLEAKEEKEIFYAIEENGILIKKDDKYQYSKENYLLLSKEILSIKNEIENNLSKHTVEFEPYILTDKKTISKLDEFTQEELKNIFI